MSGPPGSGNLQPTAPGHPVRLPPFHGGAACIAAGANRRLFLPGPFRLGGTAAESAAPLHTAGKAPPSGNR